jgi:hypothetical protein
MVFHLLKFPPKVTYRFEAYSGYIPGKSLPDKKHLEHINKKDAGVVRPHLTMTKEHNKVPFRRMNPPTRSAKVRSGRFCLFTL